MRHTDKKWIFCTVLWCMCLSVKAGGHHPRSDPYEDVCDSWKWRCLYDTDGHLYIIRFNGMYLDYFPYLRAEDMCDSYEMHLVFVETEEEQNTLRDLLTEYGNIPYWLGMTKEKKGWYWGNGYEVYSPVTWSNWAPKTYPDGFHLAMAWSEAKWHAVDGREAEVNIVICEEWDDNGYDIDWPVTETPPSLSVVEGRVETEVPYDLTTTTNTPSVLDPGTQAPTREVSSGEDNEIKSRDDGKSHNHPCPVGYCFQRVLDKSYSRLTTAGEMSVLECAVLCSKTATCDAIVTEGIICIILASRVPDERPGVDCETKTCYKVYR